MIPVSSSTLDTSGQIQTADPGESWQKALASGFRSAEELLRYLGHDLQELPYAIDTSAPFRTRVTRHFANLIDPTDPYDPILLQILPLADEQIRVPDFVADPLLEEQFQVIPGLIHKYSNRVLVIAHQACAIHCRYCFRRHFPYSEARLSEDALQEIEQYISEHPDIDEVIFSGGDPLSLSDAALKTLLERFDRFDQIETLRLHTRTPVALPQRITETLIQTLQQLNSQIVMVTHINHARELHPELIRVLNSLRQAGVHLLNQTVLLSRINDSSDIQIALSRQLFKAGVLPYYLHCLDPVSGTAHFAISEKRAQSIWQTMQENLSGYQLPRLVQEIPGRPSKTWVNPDNRY